MMIVALLMSLLPLAADAAEERQATSWLDKIDGELLAPAAAGLELDVVVTLELPATVRAARPGAEERRRLIEDVVDEIDREWSGVVTVHTRYSHLAVAHLALHAGGLDALAADPRVAFIEPNRRLRALRTEGKALMRVPAVHAAGFTGAGVGVAVVDTGVDYTHAELAPLGTKTISLWDSIGNDANAMDEAGHGTNAAGIIGGATDGVAPDARIIAVRVLDADGNGTLSQVLTGLNRILTSVTTGNPHNIKVANLSLGGYLTSGMPAQPCDSQLSSLATAFNSLTAAGVLMIASAGNGGCTDGVGWPACLTNAVAVGAVYDTAGFRVTYSEDECTDGCEDSLAVDRVACYSDSGEQLDVWAPAHFARTPTLPGTEPSASSCPFPAQAGYDPCFGGTSASAPYAAGVAALLFSAVPGRTPAQVRAALVGSGDPITDIRNNVTRNRVRADQALIALQTNCLTPPIPARPSAAVASVCTGQAFTVSWAAVAGAASYTVQVATDPAFASLVSLPQSEFTTTSASLTLRLGADGPVYVRVRANAACGASSAFSPSVQIAFTVSCSQAFPNSTFVPSVAHWPGISPAFWYTDLALLNLGAATANVRMTFYGRATAERTLTIAAGRQQTWRDVLPQAFAMSADDVGSIVVESSLPLEVNARTYSRSGGSGPSFGSTYRGVEPSRGLTSNQVGYIANLRSDGNFRTNAEVINVGTVAANVELRFFTNAGTQIGSPVTLNVGVNRRAQRDRALPAGHAAAYAQVRVLTAGARAFALASVIDGASGDPTSIEVVTPPASGGAVTYFVPSVAHWPGIAPAFWTTDLALLNLGSSTASVRMTFHGNTTTSRNLTIATGRQESWRDVLAEAFSLAGNDVGSIVVESSAPLEVNARTYSRAAATGPSFGSTYRGVTSSRGLSAGQVGVIPNLRSDGSFRTNVEAVNVGTVATTVEFRFFTNAGTQVGNPVTLSVGVNRRAQRDVALPAGQTAAYAEFRVLTAGARAFALASVVDGASGDPTSVEVVLP